jgi:hypothetical protein
MTRSDVIRLSPSRFGSRRCSRLWFLCLLNWASASMRFSECCSLVPLVNGGSFGWSVISLNALPTLWFWSAQQIQRHRLRRHGPRRCRHSGPSVTGRRRLIGCRPLGVGSPCPGPFLFDVAVPVVETHIRSSPCRPAANCSNCCCFASAAGCVKSLAVEADLGRVLKASW